MPANPNDFALGGVGLITHWAPGRFDDIRFVHGTIRPEICLRRSRKACTRPGHSRSVGYDRRHAEQNNCQSPRHRSVLPRRPDVTYRMKLRNEFGASGNLVGLVYNYQLTGSDYYEAVFSTTGTALLKKVIRGVPTIVASGTHGVPAHEWFTIEWIRDGFATTVKVDGNTVIANVVQAN